ncbi:MULTISPECIES: N-acetyl-D-Glu racemase DgcA [Pectobacterium]|uniref:N-acetyl-D-Glu racemase DgcA n=1 Tax=Pectobacterium TaxID=122277 RepID=UPI00188823D4|nr:MULTISPECIES: N-acetyl-D-Glu racemase DgcA [Pectobacterium]MBG0752203.1 L-Ala-D/L-Glu epimerase [Pectobacterium carotovorum subsp. carotovorum PCCS1]UUE46308.1 L-Ala-D/L-Glu epimerase [Pectobacterium aroidearum]UUE50529.1 L-Ala-D/L-Glu epimerase [Pectobacterium aroidearum]UUE54734.1 L-Ala-D/L-Glu epimerase [Pectobacterium aroidearum]UUE63142.1 L-Ala-D/L-Glu epimerase [Pectobacterium aroidearum]
MTEMQCFTESWPIEGAFTISRGSKRQADVVVVALQSGKVAGYGECVPYSRYGESLDSVMAQIASLHSDFRNGLDRETLQTILPAGAARNALDCAFWDLECKQHQQRIWQRLNLPSPMPLETAYTLSLDTPDRMRHAAIHNAHRPLLKLKLADANDLARVTAVREGAPLARLIVDANEGWDAERYLTLVPELAALGVTMIEQPFPAGKDDVLADLPRPIPVCADESCHDSQSLAALTGRYDMINIKLDKTGGLTEALRLRHSAQEEGLKIMVGCMVSTSLSMAPAFVVAQGAAVVDLDGPLLLQRDRNNGLHYNGSEILPPNALLWG